jgi:hypothetical protein
MMDESKAPSFLPSIKMSAYYHNKANLLPNKKLTVLIRYKTGWSP